MVAVVAVAVVVGLRVRGRVSWGDAHRKDDGHAEAGGLVVERMGADVRNLGLRRHQEQADQVAPRRRRRLLLPFSRVAPRHIVLGAHLEMGKRLGRRLVRVGRLLVTADGQCVLVEPRVHWRGHWTRLKVRSRAVCCGACDARTSLEGRKTRGRSFFFEHATRPAGHSRLRPGASLSSPRRRALPPRRWSDSRETYSSLPPLPPATGGGGSKRMSHTSR